MNHFLSIPKEWESRDEKLYYEYLIEKKIKETRKNKAHTKTEEFSDNARI